MSGSPTQRDSTISRRRATNPKHWYLTTWEWDLTVNYFSRIAHCTFKLRLVLTFAVMRPLCLCLEEFSLTSTTVMHFGLVIKISLSFITLSNAFLTASWIIPLTSTEVVHLGLLIKVSLSFIMLSNDFYNAILSNSFDLNYSGTFWTFTTRNAVLSLCAKGTIQLFKVM